MKRRLFFSFLLLAEVGLFAAIAVGRGVEVLFVVAAVVGLIVVHEVGHALVAWLCRFRVLSIRIGFGPVVARFRVAGAQVDVRVFPLEGGVRAYTREDRWLRARVLAFALAGVGSCLAVAGLIAVFAGIDVRVALAAACVLQLTNLLPVKLHLSTGIIDSDGRLAARALFGKRGTAPGAARVARAARRVHA